MAKKKPKPKVPNSQRRHPRPDPGCPKTDKGKSKKRKC